MLTNREKALDEKTRRIFQKWWPGKITGLPEQQEHILYGTLQVELELEHKLRILIPLSEWRTL